MNEELENMKRGGLQVLDGVALVAVGIVAVVIAYFVLGGIVNFVWGLIKTVVVLGVIGGALFFLLRRRRRS